jgi:hypothetical protein
MAQYDDLENVLDVGGALKKEATLKKNIEHMERIKKESAAKKGVPQLVKEKHKIALFLLLVLLVAIGLRLHVASMPLTNDWASQIVEANLQNQVRSTINEKYPSLSDEKKEELILQGTLEAYQSAENKESMESLAKQFKDSYKDPDGYTYLYEIDPYYFYGLAQEENAGETIGNYHLLPFIEFWSHKMIQLFVPSITLVGAIFYLPLIFTLLSLILLFLIVRMIWNTTAAFFAALFFAIQPLLLEFSMLGFVDTNMINIFFILLSGFLFLSIVKSWRKNKIHTLCFVLALFATIMAFTYTWSAWYISILLILFPICMMLALTIGKKIILNKEGINTKRKNHIKWIFFSIVLLLIICGFYAMTNDGVTSFLPLDVKKYLHLEYENPFGIWPDTFTLIKELQVLSLDDLINYSGGKLYALLSLFGLGAIIYRVRKGEISMSHAYLIVGYLIFFILATRAIRLLPYFLIFFSMTVGIGIATIIKYIFEKAVRPLIVKEKRIMQILTNGILFSVVVFALVYPLVGAIEERSNIMPIMDDAMYNSAVFIKENSNEDAIVNTWWDRGTFFSTLAIRETHLSSQPHMPRTYWLASLYTTTDDRKASNILGMLNCHYSEGGIFDILVNYMSRVEAMATMHLLLSLSDEEQVELLLEMTDQDISELIESKVFCQKAGEETYVVIIDDMVGRFTGVQYLAAWNYETDMPEPSYPFTDLNEGVCSRTSVGAYCDVDGSQILLDFTTLEIETRGTMPEEVFVVNNNEVQHSISESGSGMTLIVYARDGYWKAQYLPKEVANSLYIHLMFLDGYGFDSFEKVFEEVHIETSWVKVYKVVQE